MRFADIPPFVFAGALPKELGNLVNLTMLFLNGNQFRGKLYVPAYMRCMFVDISLFYRRIAQGARKTRQFEEALVAAQWLHRYDCISQHTFARFGYAYLSLRVYCTVTEDEKTALKAKLPKIQMFNFDDDYEEGYY